MWIITLQVPRLAKILSVFKLWNLDQNVKFSFKWDEGGKGEKENEEDKGDEEDDGDEGDEGD